jgi:hypothetical protein
MAEFLDLQKRALEVEEINAHSRAIEVSTKLMVEDNRIMMADLSIMNPIQWTWFKKKQMVI